MSQDIASSPPADPNWRWLRYGVLLKQLAFLVLLTAIFFVMTTTHEMASPSTVGLRLGVLSLPLVIDFIGRCCCAGAPVRRRGALIWSIGLQGAGLIGLPACTLLWALDNTGLVIGVVWAVVMQVPAAICFTNFLRSLVDDFHDARLDARVQRLHESLHRTISAGKFFGASFAVVAVVAIVLGLTYYGMCLCITVPVGLAVMLPILIWVCWRVSVMWARYGVALFRITQLLETQPPPAAEESSTSDEE